MPLPTKRHGNKLLIGVRIIMAALGDSLFLGEPD
jgi:hypothetical protein